MKMGRTRRRKERKGRKRLTLFPETLKNTFSKWGRIEHIRLVRDIVTGESRGYAFVTYAHSRDFVQAFKVWLFLLSSSSPSFSSPSLPSSLPLSLSQSVILTHHTTIQEANHLELDGRQILVDFERERVMTGWVPRRLGT